MSGKTTKNEEGLISEAHLRGVFVILTSPLKRLKNSLRFIKL